MKIAVLGAGMVGRAIAADLASQHTVTSFDISQPNLEQLKQSSPDVEIRQADLNDYTHYATLLAPYDLVVTAVPGFMGYAVLEAAIRAGKNIVDISFFPEDVLALDALAREQGVTVITDCGVAPGMNNFIIGRYNEEMAIKEALIYVGGLPQHPQPPFLYKAPFSPIDVIEEYTRPARLVENGEIVVRPALSERELLSFDGVGELEAFNTDGLRSLLFTMKHIPDMKEKTLRYPGHIDLIVALQTAGFFNTDAVKVSGQMIRPLDFSAAFLIDQWKLQPGEQELTVMKVMVKSESQTVIYELLDKYDEASQTSSMARSTGYTCTAAVNLIANGLFTEKGVYPPELVGRDKTCFDFVLDYLGERGVHWRKTTRPVGV
ncbi:MAG: saccharopine dehydrogenase [Sphingobacteriales bacterium SCN 48-20]|uniref:saccharopine dehydrogenase family protein n=1 Tax=Terrimonas ferruginea TaxID=249 RepID=UPI00086E1213|nr:saccharopine dehydrogenase C-terminal domain-containing protein [Terrimonas ferruginea]MBN8783476.1 saccharopine dehydrogenase NADP-binding domain-containing protein [Terrimonas ferruginea]ODT91999.1 MAG: saccharopine dehydrogenase [Sphingobacteriales bacterium SCN 48-20]OJW40237.1 MAG: saccharopine dehydrogenase [Sphingobacteriales bacterium 48-107]